MDVKCVIIRIADLVKGYKRRLHPAFLIIVMLAGMTACTSHQTGEEKKELVVFAAASMTETLNEIAELYQEIESDVTITYNFDSSGTLKTQIEEGAQCDVFISAAEKQMDALETENRFDLVENQVVLAVTKTNPAGITSFADLETEKLHLIGLGNADVPVGAYSEEILEYLGIKEKLERSGKITYASNVKEVTTQIQEGAVDCGMIYATDACAAKLLTVDKATDQMCSRAVYPAAVLKTSPNKKEAQVFLDYLRSEECSAVFEAAGFRVLYD